MKDPRGKCHGEGDPNRGPDTRFFGRNDVRFSIKKPEIDRENREDNYVKDDPRDNASVRQLPFLHRIADV
jgi:hypothetical protein